MALVANPLPNRETPINRSRFILACYSDKRGGLERQRQQDQAKQNLQSIKDLIVVEDDVPTANRTSWRKLSEGGRSSGNAMSVKRRPLVINV